MPRLINLRQIEAFRAVMLTGSTTRAAPLLGITQPAVSRLISDLEAQVGFHLFGRIQGRLRPGPEAEELFAEIERAFVSLNHITNFLQGLNQTTGGQLRILATIPMAHGLLPAAIMRFRAESQETVISVKTVIRRDIRAWLDAQQFDLALTNFPVDYPDTGTEPLISARGVCVLPAGHPLAARRNITAQDLADEPFIVMAAESQNRYRVDRAFERAKVRPRIAIEAQTGSVICELVAAGAGVSVVDPIIARTFRDKGILCRPFSPAVQYEFRILYPIQREPSRRARAFAELAREVARDLDLEGAPCSRDSVAR